MDVDLQQEELSTAMEILSDLHNPNFLNFQSIKAKLRTLTNVDKRVTMV